jgi:hypothetical protein
MEQTPPSILPTAKPNWWMRNWKWFVPLGCFSLVVLFVGLVTSVVLIAFSAVKSTDVYKDAVARAKSHPAGIEALGSHITKEFWSQGTQTSTARPVKRTSPFRSQARRETGRSTSRQRSRLAEGTIPGLFWKSIRRINGSIFLKALHRQISLNAFDATRHQAFLC